MGKSKAHRIKGLTGPKMSLGDQMNEGRVSKKPKAPKIRLRAEEEDFVDSRATKKILQQARKQQAELNILGDSFGPSLAESVAAANASGKRRHRLGDAASSDESDEEYREEADVDGQDFFDDIKMNAEDERALEMFQNK
ncbi:bystin-like [Armigeres subalbatus]|uniref:bystin-like n=1 Tax=Armigeres subalbatus TaxID=124917 RepID=UPI002ED07EF5